MRRTFLFSLLTITLLLPACALPTHDQLEMWKANTDKALAGAARIAEDGIAAANAVKAQLDDLKNRYQTEIDKLEAIAGPIDVNRDGKVTSDEVAAFTSKLRSTEQGREVLYDWQTWVAIAGAWVGVKGTKKIASAVAVMAYDHAKDKNGDGVVDAEEAKA